MSYFEFIADRAISQNRASYQITIIYKSADTPTKTTAALKFSLPTLFNVIVDANWRRKNIIGSFEMYAFLDDPGSRYRAFDEALPIASAQDSFHHHSILLVEPWIADRTNRRYALNIMEDASSTHESSDFRRRIMQQSKRRPLKPDRFARKYLGNTPIRSCLIQHLPTIADVERATIYASKSTRRLFLLFPDDYFLILP